MQGLLIAKQPPDPKARHFTLHSLAGTREQKTTLKLHPHEQLQAYQAISNPPKAHWDGDKPPLWNSEHQVEEDNDQSKHHADTQDMKGY